jgi:hypothetical protein
MRVKTQRKDTTGNKNNNYNTKKTHVGINIKYMLDLHEN